MLQTPDVFTYDLQELNSSITFVISLSKVTGRHIKVAKSGALAVFSSMQSFEHFKGVSEVASESNPYEVSLDEMKEIANRESEGFYEIL